MGATSKIAPLMRQHYTQRKVWASPQRVPHSVVWEMKLLHTHSNVWATPQRLHNSVVWKMRLLHTHSIVWARGTTVPTHLIHGKAMFEMISFMLIFIQNAYKNSGLASGGTTEVIYCFWQNCASINFISTNISLQT